MKLFGLIAASCLLSDIVHARSWKDIEPLHGLKPRDTSANHLYFATDPLFSPAPSQSPSLQPSQYPSAQPTRTLQPSASPSEQPTSQPSSAPSPAPDPFPPNDVPNRPDPWYFNYDTSPDAAYGPGQVGLIQRGGTYEVGYTNNNWANVQNPPDSYWKEFTDNGFGTWKAALQNRQPLRNRCNRVGMQSPIDLRESGAECEEHHEVRSLPGDFRIHGDKVEKRIESNKLRLVFERRNCADLENITCAEPDPPHADFPNGWGGFADAMHVDFKVPSEHMVYGQRFDAEMQIYHLHPGRRRMPTVSALIKATDLGYNYMFEEALKAFQYVYDTHRGQCARKIRRERRLMTEVHQLLGGNVTSDFVDYEPWAEFSTDLDRPDYDEYAQQMERKLQFQQNGIWDPHHELLVPSIHFFRYDGSLTEPPCGEWVSWFVSDQPMIISTRQLQVLQTILFTHVDADCTKTSIHFDHSVARPIQDAAGRPVYRCKASDFGPDQ